MIEKQIEPFEAHFSPLARFIIKRSPEMAIVSRVVSRRVETQRNSSDKCAVACNQFVNIIWPTKNLGSINLKLCTCCFQWRFVSAKWDDDERTASMRPRWKSQIRLRAKCVHLVVGQQTTTTILPFSYLRSHSSNSNSYYNHQHHHHHHRICRHYHIH